MSVLTRPLTHTDLAQFPDDGKRYEIIEGELYVAAAPVRWHQKLLLRIYRTLYAAAEEFGWGEVYTAPVDVKFGDTTVVQPDLLVIRQDLLHHYRGNTMYAPPDLVVEVLSPSNRAYDETIKARAYAAAGVPELLLGDPERLTLRLFVLLNSEYVLVEPDANGRLHSTIVPGLIFDPAVLLARLHD
ncbi:MAG: Uma2 family endonuclease [Thermomicrobiales bacterium]